MNIKKSTMAYALTFAAGVAMPLFGIGVYHLRKAYDAANARAEAEIVQLEQKYKIIATESESLITGTVLEEIRTGGYTLKLKTDKGKEIYVTVKQTEDVSLGYLDGVIQSGTRIQFPRGNIMGGFIDQGVLWLDEFKETYFHPVTKNGSKLADRIRVLERKRK